MWSPLILYKEPMASTFSFSTTIGAERPVQNVVPINVVIIENVVAIGLLAVV